MNELDDDYGNVRAALRWAAVTDPCTGTRMLAGTRDLFFRFGQADGLELARQLLERCPARDRHRVEAQMATGQLAISMGEPETARTVLAEAHELNAEVDEPVLEAWVLFFQGLTETLAGAFELGREYLQTSRVLHHELGIGIGIGEARSIAVLSMSSLMAGEVAGARELLETALSIYRAEGDQWGQGQCHTFLGVIAEDSGPDPSVARSHYRRLSTSCVRPATRRSCRSP